VFEKKSKNVAERMMAIDSRILELRKKRDSKSADMKQKEAEISTLLGTLAMGTNAKAQESLKLGRTALGRMTETYNDLAQQVGLLENNRKGLEREFLEALIRDLPGRMELSLEEFNQVLDDSLRVMETLRDMHTKLRDAEKVFTDLMKEYQDTCTKLGVVQPLDLPIGLGALARVPSPWAMSFATPEFLFFIQSLEGYRLKLAGYEGFKAADPNYDREETLSSRPASRLGCRIQKSFDGRGMRGV
jgi:hypothetical protein